MARRRIDDDEQASNTMLSHRPTLARVDYTIRTQITTRVFQKNADFLDARGSLRRTAELRVSGTFSGRSSGADGGLRSAAWGGRPYQSPAHGCPVRNRRIATRHWGPSGGASRGEACLAPSAHREPAPLILMPFVPGTFSSPFEIRSLSLYAVGGEVRTGDFCQTPYTPMKESPEYVIKTRFSGDQRRGGRFGIPEADVGTGRTGRPAFSLLPGFQGHYRTP